MLRRFQLFFFSALLLCLALAHADNVPAGTARRPSLSLAKDGNLICPAGTSRQRDTHPPRWGDTTWDEWCIRPDGKREGPQASWYAGAKTIRQAAADAHLQRVVWLREGRPHGPLLQYFAGEYLYSHWPKDPRISQAGRYEEGKREGNWLEYYPGPGDRLLRIYNYRRDLLDGAWVERHANGRPWVLGQYASGKPHGQWRHLDTVGRQSGIVELREGTGPWAEWYPNGRPLLRGELSDGRPSGRWTVWHVSGKRAAEIEYSAATVSRMTLWEPDGSQAVAFPVKIEGAPDRRTSKKLETVVRRHINEVKYCYIKELQAIPRVSGRLVVRVVITEKGQVQQSQVAHSTIPDHISSCIASACRRWLFVASGSEQRVQLPFFIQRGVAPIEAEREHGIAIDRDLLGAPRGISVLRFGRKLIRERIALQES